MKKINKYIVLYMMIMGAMWFVQFKMVENGMNIYGQTEKRPLSTLVVSLAEGQDSSQGQVDLEVETLPANGEEITEQQESKGKPAYYTVKNQVLYKGSGEENKIALTFDDGPDPYYTEKLLDFLKEHQIKATFFLIGAHVEKYPHVVARIAQEGHVIGNHSWGHKKFTWLQPWEVQRELKKTEDLIDSIAGYHANIFRPPFGTMNKKTLERVNAAGYNVVNWSVDTKDWSGIPVSKILYYVKMQLKPGGIVLMHSSGKKQAMENMLASLPEIIQLAKENGYEFVTVPEVLGLEEKVDTNLEEEKPGE
ncbi:peptidoglycan/xylan/chitin deacetylase (PgdA/CDA1 family) [Anaerosolibacter carboniphilus]|uniref:Peptidoglycan/xylan/chitin deacetylase (PgdA/CDA1 family) n=1 Tax=Anaerosolibacter carboniphilus TaxID=1417629 RepID=A0A841KKR2_9FIRM|nr:polysaccharide deacetylase family protein [Anaerosolibacter carboniphilus]MBB6214027.1 peptidoglycan/xylan/chitin deacetylase (PgdA/CDA1 family) [Anaerosolibacter carboniphilus]